MHQNAFGGRTPPGLTGGAYGTPPDPLAGLRGRGVGKGKGKQRERGRGREKKERGGPPMSEVC